jgi:SAM-dependent methyltransferase
MIDPRLARELTERYGVGPAFAEAYMEFWLRPGGRQDGQQVTALKQILALPPPDSVWFNFAMTTNQRGRELCALILGLPQLQREPRRVLDVGCGFGGLLAAFAARGCEVRGLELDPDRVALALANGRDQGWSDPAAIVTTGDIQDEALVATLGRFDVITLVDVIEHVLDVPRTIARVAALLNPGGIALLEVPNRQCLRWIARDGHFSMFGITLLDREMAIAYHRTAFPFAYDVGDYHEMDFYRRRFELEGCAFAVAGLVPPASSVAEVPALLEDVKRAFEHYMTVTRPTVPLEVDAALQVNVAEYLSALVADYQRVTSSEAARQRFISRYLASFWRVVAVKGSGAAASGT